MALVYSGFGSRENAQEALSSYVNASVCALKYKVERARAPTGDFASLTCARLGEIKVLHCLGNGVHRSFRADHQIREDRLDHVLLVVSLQAQVTVKQAGRLAQAGPESFMFVSTAKPFSCESSPTGGRDSFSCHIISIPAPLLRQHVPRIDGCCDQIVTVRPGTSKIMVDLVKLAVSEGEALTEVEAQRFGTTLVDAVVSATLGAPELRCLQSARRETALERVQTRAKSYIDCRLSDSELNQDDIARHCKVSVRYLNTAFAAHSTTVGTFIREKRLEQCRRALVNPSMSDKSIIEIAMKWGFNDPAYFSRAYRVRFGNAPSVDRRSAPA